MKARAICVTILVGLAFILIHVFFSEPRYHGRTLTSWLQQYDNTPPMNDPQRRHEALVAVQTIGVKKALPVLLELVATKDDPISLWLIDKSEKYRERMMEKFLSASLEDYEQLRWHDAREFQLLGVAGFEMLGTNAAPAVEALEKLLNDKAYDFVITRSLVYIGKPAEPVFCRALTNRDPELRQWSIGELADVTADVGTYIARIEPRLQDSDESVRITAVDAIGWQKNAPELVIPILVKTLNDSSDSVGAHAANSLANFGTNALPVFQILSNLVKNSHADTASAALTTLITIAPEAAFPILTNCIACGKPATSDAINALANVAPEKALPIILVRWQSADVKIKRSAFGLLLHLPPTPEIESIMQNIATGSDSHFVLSAKSYSTDRYETNHPNEFPFPDEPDYDGKPLAAWLKTRNDGNGDFTPAAKEAFRQMGTNAIPALLKRLAYTRPPYCFSPFQININAAGGFIELGELAKPALPKLWQVMDSTNHETALVAMIATMGTGSNAAPFLIKGLTNPFPDVRNQAANILSDEFGKKFPEQLKTAIPLFVKLLTDPDNDVRLNATNQLKQIDPIAAAQAGIK